MDKLRVKNGPSSGSTAGNIEPWNRIPVYPVDTVKVDNRIYTVFELKRRYDAFDKRLVLDSDFQRNSVWGRKKKSELVESVLMGLPLPIFYFNQDRYGRLIVVDGRQRLTALFEYMNDYFPLTRLSIFYQFNGLKCSDLPPVMQSRLEDFQIQSYIILPSAPDRIKFDIFDRVNRGGMKLNRQEIRNALYQGNATKMLGELANSEEFQLATGNAFAKEKRMKDKYLLTRFAGCYLLTRHAISDDFGRTYRYKGDIEDLLGRTMELINGMTETEVEKLTRTIKNTLRKSYDYLGSDGFRLVRKGRRSPVNMNIFETVMYAMLWIPAGKTDICQEIRERLFGFIESNEFRENMGDHRDSEEKLYWRLEQAERLGRLLSDND